MTKTVVNNKVCDCCGNPKSPRAMSCRSCYLKIIRPPGFLSGVCAICGEEIDYMGNNPYPVIKDPTAGCCDYCDDMVVTPARFKEMAERYNLELA